MKTLPIIVTLIALINLPNVLSGQDLESTKDALKIAAKKEQNAFKNGDCDAVLAMMTDDITFLANGKPVPSKAVIAKFCNALPRPFKTPIKDQLEFFALTEDSGYTIRTLVYPHDEAHHMKEFVTKIWQKIDGVWKIKHLHSSANKISNTNP